MGAAWKSYRADFVFRTSQRHVVYALIEDVSEAWMGIDPFSEMYGDECEGHYNENVVGSEIHASLYISGPLGSDEQDTIEQLISDLAMLQGKPATVYYTNDEIDGGQESVHFIGYDFSEDKIIETRIEHRTKEIEHLQDLNRGDKLRLFAISGFKQIRKEKEREKAQIKGGHHAS